MRSSILIHHVRYLSVIAMAFLSWMEPAKAASQIRNIVLVHGAFSDGSCWSEVIKLLQQKGYKVTAVQNPLTSLAADVSATQRVLERQVGDTLLVGHSWAGAVITVAGNFDRVKRLVYISALVPDSGQSVGEMLASLNAPMDSLKPDIRGDVWLDDASVYKNVMAFDLPIQKIRVLTAIEQPIQASAFQDKVSHAAWRDKPSWYLLTENDNALKPEVQRQIATHIKARITPIKSSHMSMLSHPSQVADLIDRAAKGS